MSKTGKELYDDWRGTSPDRWGQLNATNKKHWDDLAKRFGGKIDVTDRVRELDPGLHNVGPDPDRTDFKGYSASITDFSGYRGMQRLAAQLKDPKVIPRFEIDPKELQGKTNLSDDEIAQRAEELIRELLIELLDEPEMRQAIIEAVIGGEDEESEPDSVAVPKLQEDLDYLRP